MTAQLRRASATLIGAVALLVAAACGDDGSGPDKGVGGEGDSSLRLIAGAGVEDTIFARHDQGLVVEVRDDEGVLRPGVVVRFESGPSPDSTRRFERGVLVCAVTAADCGGFSGGYFVADSTDARGRSVVQVRHGSVAGPTYVIVTVPEFGLRDSFPFTTRPGAGVKVVATPRDTAVQLGSSFALGGAVVDRFGNARPADAVTMTAGPSVTVASGQVTGATIGRGYVLLKSGARTDTAYVSVVPAGRVAAVVENRLVVANFDGSARREIDNLVSDWGLGLRPAWVPGSTRLIVNATDGTKVRLQEVDEVAGTRRPLGVPTELVQELFPAVTSANSGRVYFTGLTSGGSYELWQMTLAGTAPQRRLSNIATYGGYFRPAVSPDGTLLAAAVLAPGGVGVQVFDASTGAAIGPTLLNAHSPKFSPDGQWIAVGTPYGGPIRVMRSNGTEVRTVTPRNFGEWVDWTADGQWLIGTSGPAMELIRVATGETLPLQWTTGMYQPAVKR
jgi:hypothetical protein